MPFGKYQSFEECVLDNQDKENPEAYCAAIQKAAEKGLEGPIVFKSASKQIVVGPVLVPGEPDHEGEALTEEKIEEVAHGFLEHFRYVDVEHSLKQIAVPVTSDLLRFPETHVIDGEEVELPVGTWMLGSKIQDSETWKQVEQGVFKGYSVMGVSREQYEAATKTAAPRGMMWDNGILRKILLSDLGEDWIGVAVSILEKPSVFKSRFVAIKSQSEDSWWSKLFRFDIKGALKTKPKTKEGMIMPLTDDDRKEVKDIFIESLKETLPGALKEAQSNEEQEKALAALQGLKPEEIKELEGLKGLKPEEIEGLKKLETTPAPPADEVVSEEVKKEMEAMKSRMDEQDKVIEKMGEFASSAVKSQALPGAEDFAATKTEDDKKGGEIKRDFFGRRIGA